MESVDVTSIVGQIAGTIGVRYRSFSDYPRYAVGDDGSYWSCGHFASNTAFSCRKCSSDKFGYKTVTMFNASGKFKTGLHRVVLLAFVGLCPEGMECRHLNGNPSDNRLENLQWGTRQENANDRKRHGTTVTGEKSPTCILTEAQVVEIRELLDADVPMRQIAKQYGTARSNIRFIADGVSWFLLPQCKTFRSGLRTGNRHPMAVLNEDLVREIRGKYKAGNVSINALAREYKVTVGTMSDVVNNKTWKMVLCDGPLAS